MAQFRAYIQGLGTKKSGIDGACNGWDIGIRFSIKHINGEDVVSVGITRGSNNGTVVKDLGTFKESDFTEVSR